MVENGGRGAMVARLTPDQKVACSIHVALSLFNLPIFHCPVQSASLRQPNWIPNCPGVSRQSNELAISTISCLLCLTLSQRGARDRPTYMVS